MSTPKQKIIGGTKAIRQKPHVRMFSRKTGMIGCGVALASIMGVLILDPMEFLRGMGPSTPVEERVEPPPPKMDLEGLPTDRSRTGEGSRLDVSSVAAPPPDKPLGVPDMDLPPSNGVPKGFPPAETGSGGGLGGGQKASGPKVTRKALGFDGGDDPYDSIANTPQQGHNGQTQTPQMAAMNQDDEGGSKADKFRSQNRGGGSMFLGNDPISAKSRPGYGQITPGTMIQAKLASATNSELGGAVVARVSVDVYDKATGQCLMLDNENSEIFGKLSDQVEYGQNRQQAVWKSIHTPKMHLDIGGMDATDASGGTGIDSETNRHYGRLAVAAIGATFLDVLGGWARSSKNNGTEVNIGTSAANNVAGIGQQIIQRELQVKDELYQIIGKPVSLMVDRIIELPCLNRS